MAARWGAGEEILTACNLDFFATNTLDKTVNLDAGEALDALQGCLDPSILSLFEDAPTGEGKSLDDESEATLLTALTEILDNVDDENLSPFDTLPDSDLLSGQKAREHSPLRRLLCLSRSPPEKDGICNNRTSSSGKSLPRGHVGSIQRSDGEEEEDGSLTLSPRSQPSSLHQELLDWGGLTLPLPFAVESEEEDSDGLSVSLGDLVRHMHPYCMTVCVENEEGEQMLPEGGILLEVVDQGEHGEPILAIPDLSLPLSLLQDSLDTEQKVPTESDKAAFENLEHIIVDTTSNVAKIGVDPVQNPEVKCEGIKRPKALRTKEIKEKSPPRRKNNGQQIQPDYVEGRILRSTRRAIKGSPQKLKKGLIKEKKSAPLVSHPSPKPKKKQNACQPQTEVTKLTLPPENKVNVPAVTASGSFTVKEIPDGPSIPPTTVNLIQPNENRNLATTSKKPDASSTATALPITHVVPLLMDHCSPSDSLTTPEASHTNGAARPTVVLEVNAMQPPAPEPKPKSLSLAEYRRLRQQKKPAPIEKQEDQSTKWPSLPELPKELPPIPCLPDPSPKDTRRSTPLFGKKEAEEVRPAWQPTGPGAPPTPEALLVPPAYMVASSTKVGAATLLAKRQQQSVPQPEPASKVTQSQPPSAASPKPLKDIPPTLHANTPSEKSCVPQSSVSATTSSSTPSEGKFIVGERAHSQPITTRALVLTEMPAKATTESLKAIAAPGSVHTPTTEISKTVPKLIVATSMNKQVASASKFTEPAGICTQTCSLAVKAPHRTQGKKATPVMLGAQECPTAKPKEQRTSAQELVEAFTSEIGIEATDLTSLLEQFEETQAKEKQCVPEVSGRAAAVGNSSVEIPPEKTAIECVKANDPSSIAVFLSTATPTPPATPPHQMWKPLAPVALLGKNGAIEASRPSPSRVIQIEAQPLPSVKFRSVPTASTVAPEWAFIDHDYCLPNNMASAGEHGKRWNVKQQPSITIRTVKQLHATSIRPPQTASTSSPVTTQIALGTRKPEAPLKEPLTQRPAVDLGSSILDTPDASPTRQEAEPQQGSPRTEQLGQSHRRHADSRSPSPRAYPKDRKRGRSRKRYQRSSSSSESDSNSSPSSSVSRSPPSKRYRSPNSESSSSSSSRSSSCSSSRSPPRRRKYSYSSSRSGSWSLSRSRSRSPQRHAQWQRKLYSPSYRPGYRHSSRESAEDVKRRKQQAIDERRVVYVGRIQGTMTRTELRERFSLYGRIEDCTLHFREHGDNYGFVTYYDTKHAFTAIENGGKLRKPDELPFDLCFGGRRQFCKTSYSDLDSNREYESLPSKGKFHALDFDTLLKQAQKNQKR